MGGTGLVAWGGGPVAAARARQLEGARIVCWPGSDAAPLSAASLAFERAEDLLGSAGIAACEQAGRRWARIWARLPLCESKSFRDLATWRGESLLWTCETFLGARSAGTRCAAGVELCLRLLSALAPSEVDACGLAEAETVLLARAATASRILFQGALRRARPLPVEATPAGLPRRPSLLSRGLSWTRAQPVGPRRLVVLVDSLVETRLPSLLEIGRGEEAPFVLRTADLPNHGGSGAREAAGRAAAGLRSLHAAIAGTPALAASYAHRGVVFDDLAGHDLAALLLQRLPATVQRLECAREMVEAARPELLVVAVADADERRSYGLVARACGVPWAALRLDPARSEEAERADGGPQPSATVAVPAGAGAADLLAPLLAANRRTAASA